MKKFKYVYLLLVLTLFIPKVYAFTYDFSVDSESYSVTSGTVKEVKVFLKNIQGTTYGISSCSLNIQFEDDVLLDSKINTLNSWTMTTGKVYLFDTGTGVLNDSAMFSVPVKVNGKGIVKFTDIQCSDGETKVSVNDKSIFFTITTDKPNNIIQDNVIDDENDNNVVKSSNCNLSNILLSEGSIEFDPNVTEYSVKVNRLDELNVTPILEDNNSTYVVIENADDGSVNYEISVKAQDGSSKVYTLYVTKTDEVINSNGDKKSINFIPIFIGIICLLVLVNIFRIIKNKKK